jgi:phenylacetate-CoA ligase
LKRVKDVYEKSGRHFSKEIKNAHLSGHLWNLPFVYLYERSDFSVTFSGAQIYPEEVRRALLDKVLEHKISGKFTMIAGYDKNAKNYLELNIELKKDVEPSRDLEAVITKSVVANLLKENSEYRVLYEEYKSALNPKVKLWPKDHPLYFNGQGKQKWVKKVA